MISKELRTAAKVAAVAPNQGADGIFAEDNGTGELANRIRGALFKAHGDTQILNSAELAPLDQFHVRGLAATKEMADARPSGK